MNDDKIMKEFDEKFENTLYLETVYNEIKAFIRTLCQKFEEERTCPECGADESFQRHWVKCKEGKIWKSHRQALEEQHNELEVTRRTYEAMIAKHKLALVEARIDELEEFGGGAMISDRAFDWRSERIAALKKELEGGE